MRIDLTFFMLAGLAALSACGPSPKFDKSNAAKSPQMNTISADTPAGAGSEVNATAFVGPDQVPPAGKHVPNETK